MDRARSSRAAHRRIDADGHPTVADIEEGIRAARSSSIGLLAVERKAAGDVIGYCGLVDSGRGAEGEPELANEAAAARWGQGTATEASLGGPGLGEVARYEGLCHGLGLEHRISTRAGQLGFVETDRTEDPAHGTNLFNTRRLWTRVRSASRCRRPRRRPRGRRPGGPPDRRPPQGWYSLGVRQIGARLRDLDLALLALDVSKVVASVTSAPGAG